MRRAGSFAAWAAALFGALYAVRHKSWKVKAAVVAGFLVAAVVVGALLSNAAVTNVYYVDKDSTGGTCSDVYSEATARNSTSHPFCTVDAADSVVPSGAYIRVRAGIYPDWKIDAAKSAMTTITPYRGETVKTTGIWFSAAAKWAVNGVEVTGTDGTVPPGTDTGRVLVDASSNIALGNLYVHNTVQGVRVVNGSSNVKVEGGRFEDLSCSLYAADGGTCGTNDEGSGVSADAAITGLTVTGTKFTDLEGEAVESGVGATESLDRIDALTRNTDRIGTWTVADIGGSSFNTAYQSVADGATKVFRVPPGDYSTAAATDPLITTPAFTATTADTFTSTAHGFSNGDQVRLFGLSTASAGVTNNQTYFVIGATANTFQISTTSGGTAVDVTASLSGLLDPKTPGTRVVFLATAEHGVSIAKMFPRDGGSYATFEDFKVGTFYARRSIAQTWKDICVCLNDTSPLPAGSFTADGTSSHSSKNIFFVKGATDAKIVGGSMGPNYIWDDYDGWQYGCGTGDVGGDATPPAASDDCDSGAAPQIDCYPSCSSTGNSTVNLLISGMTLGPQIQNRSCRTAHDGNAAYGFTDQESCGDGHGDCIHWFSGSGTIRGNTFTGCWVTDILPVKTSDLTVENNVFKPQTPSDQTGPYVDSGPTSVSLTGTCGSNTHTNLTIRNNTWLGTTSLTMTTGPCFTNAQIYDNAMAKINTANNACTHTGVTWTNNKAAAEFSGTCGSSSKIQITGDNQVNATSGVPNRGSLLINAATGTPPSFDHEGFARPFGSTADVGAFEYPVR